jgi:hypothetical protein
MDTDETKEHVNSFRKQLLDDLNENKDPKFALETFQKSIEEWDQYDSEKFDEMYKKLQGNYYIYVALKKIIKGYALLTIRCLQDYFEMTGSEVPEGENILLYNKTRLDESFPDHEIETVFTDQQDEQKELENLSKVSNSSFNSDLAKQHRYQHLLSLYVANGKLDEEKIDKQNTPQYNFKKLVSGNDIPKAHEQHLV